MSPALHIAHGVLSLDVGGLERIVLGLARAGLTDGHRVSVICVERPGTLAAEARVAGASVVSLDKPPGRRGEFVGRAARVLEDLKPDVLHTHQTGAAWYLARAARARGGPPVLHTEHGNMFALTAGRWQRFKYRWLLRRTARNVDKFCCVSDEIARAVTRWGAVPRAKVEVVPNGIGTGDRTELPPPGVIRASLGIPDAASVLGTVGRLAEVKRQDLLVRAAAKLRETVPGLHLVLVGDGPERGNLERLTRSVGLGDRVHFVGYQPSPEAYLRVMDVFALTSRSEGFPVSILEAWAAGVPVACSAVGGIPDVVTPERDGMLFPPGDESAIVACVGRLLGDRDLRLRLAEAGNRTVRKRYSLERVAGEYESRYRSLIAAREGVR